MHITLLQENLIKAIQLAIRFVATKPQIPILTGITLRTKDGKLTIQSTDLRVGFQTTLMVKSEADGEIVVPAKIFSEFLHSLSPGPLELRLDKETLIVSQKNVKAKLATFAIAEFPPFPENTTTPLHIPREKFIDTIDSVLYAASLDETRPVLASLLFDFKESMLTCACTDGYRLSVASTEVDTKNDEPQSLLLPARAVQEVLTVAKSSHTENVHLSVSKELSQVFVVMGEYTILLRMVEGQFPPYEKIIPRSFSLETTLLKEEWVGALRTAMVFARESSSVVTLTFSEAVCTISSAGASAGENEAVISSSTKINEAKKISFNGKYLLDILSHIKEDQIVFKMSDELKPGLLLPEGKEFPLSVVMPFKR